VTIAYIYRVWFDGRELAACEKKKRRCTSMGQLFLLPIDFFEGQRKKAHNLCATWFCILIGGAVEGWIDPCLPLSSPLPALQVVQQKSKRRKHTICVLLGSVF
jgi:hypothetical protein